jgi:hypothetical protein
MSLCPGAIVGVPNTNIKLGGFCNICRNYGFQSPIEMVKTEDE